VGVLLLDLLQRRQKDRVIVVVHRAASLSTEN
jgi:hypothetical protein